MRLKDPERHDIDVATRKVADFVFLDFERNSIYNIVRFVGSGSLRKDLYDADLLIEWKTDKDGIDMCISRVPK